MNKLSLSLISTAVLGAPAAAQIPNFLMTYSQQKGGFAKVLLEVGDALLQGLILFAQLARTTAA